MANKIYGAIADDGGGTGALDAIDGSLLVDGDVGIVCDYSASVVEVYRLVAGSGAAEIAGEPYPTIIEPVSNAGTKRWILVGSVAQGITLAKNNTYLNIYDEATPPVVVGTLKIDGSGHTNLNAKTGKSVLLTINGTTIGTWSATGLTLAAGTTLSAPSITTGTGGTITEFSTDGTMAGNSDTAVPTEKAVVTYAESLVGTDGSGVLGYKNKFINGNFDIWQRGTSFSANGYTADRWKLYIVGDSMTITKEAHTTGQTDVPGNPVYYLKAANTLAAGASNLSMILYGIEDVNIFAGETVTMSFYAKAAAGTPRIAISISQNFGGGGSAAVATYGGVTTLSTSWEKHTITMAIPSISGKTVGSSSYTQIQIWLSAGSDFDAFTDTLGQQSIEVSFSEMQIESGSVATQFDRRHVAQELAMCQRYYTIVTLTPLYLLGLLTTAIYFPYIFPQQMRIAPTMSVVTQVTYYSGGSGVNITPTFYAPDGRGFSLYLSSLTNGNGIAGGVVAAYADF